MSFRVIVGNFLDDALNYNFENNNLDSDMPAIFAHDGPGKNAARFAEDLGNAALDIFLNLVSQIEDDWTAITGSVENSADQDHGFDASSLKLLGNAANADSVEYSVRSGQSYWVEGWAFGSGTGPTGKISVYNPNTRKWWDGAAWVGSVAYLATSASAAWVGIGAGAGVQVDIEPISETLAPTTTIQLQLWRVDNSTADPVYFDDLYLYAGVDFVGIFGGHNIPPWVEVQWVSQDSASSPTTQATFTKAKDQFFAAKDSTVFAPFHYVTFGGGSPIGKLIYFGDLVVGKIRTLPNGPEDPVSVSYEEKGQARLAVPGGTEYVTNRGPAPPRTVSFGMSFRTAAETEEALAILVDGLRGGEVACVVIPEDVQLPDLAVYCRIQQPIEFSLSPRAGDLPTGGGQEHYSRVRLSFVEGAIFEVDD
jgi:hypothetical protein